MLPFSTEIMFVGTLIATAISTVLWINKQFFSLRAFTIDRLDKLAETILSKLEYHERHDDRRFGDLKNDIWDLRVHNAANDAAQVRRDIETKDTPKTRRTK